MITDKHYIRFDWAMKRLLRNKANHAVLEGFITTLLGQKLTIVRFLESESNKQDEQDKFNRVDILAESDKGELFIIEIQNNRELSYFHRMLYGASKAVTEYIGRGDEYDKVRKVYSINIVYFDLGQGADYVYHGMTEFRGLHDPSDILRLSARQNEVFFGVKAPGIDKRKPAGALFPEYYVLKVDEFDKVAKTPLDEWIAFLKDGVIADETRVPGLAEARECLNIDHLTGEERRAYMRHMENVRYQKSVIGTGIDDGIQIGKKIGLEEGERIGLEKGKQEAAKAIARSLRQSGVSPSIIAQSTGLTPEEIEQL